jgi:hypothetical protein
MSATRTQRRPLGMEKLSRAARLALITERFAFFGRATDRDMDIFINSADISYSAYQAAIRQGLDRRAKAA